MNPSSLRVPLFLTRLSIFYFLLPWQVMRFSAPERINGIAKKYYKISSIPDSVTLIIGVLMMATLVAFLLGFKKRISYGFIFIIHAVGTLMSFPAMIPFLGLEGYNQLFLASIPTSFAMLLLYMLRNEDTLLSIDK